MGDTPTSPGKGFALATHFRPLPIRPPSPRRTLIGPTFHPYGAGTLYLNSYSISNVIFRRSKAVPMWVR